MTTPRAKFQAGAPPDETPEMIRKNPRRLANKSHAKPSGKSGKGRVKSGRVSTFKDGYRD